MISLESRLTNMELDYAELKDQLESRLFMLSGNWDYHQGVYDRRLDGERQTVWLRIPFEVVHGQLDAQAPQPGTRVKLGTPYVLRHMYNDGDDHTADFNTLGALVDQFQAPIDPDGQVQPAYVTEARGVLQEVEAIFLVE